MGSFLLGADSRIVHATLRQPSRLSPALRTPSFGHLRSCFQRSGSRGPFATCAPRRELVRKAPRNTRRTTGSPKMHQWLVQDYLARIFEVSFPSGRFRGHGQLSAEIGTAPRAGSGANRGRAPCSEYGAFPRQRAGSFVLAVCRAQKPGARRPLPERLPAGDVVALLVLLDHGHELALADARHRERALRVPAQPLSRRLLSVLRRRTT